MKRTEESKDMLKWWRNICLLLALVLAAVVAHAYVFGGRDGINIRKAREQYPLIDVARHLIPQEHFLSTLQPLRERLYDLVASETDMHIAVYLEFLNTGSNISINQDTRFVPASLAKIPLALAVMGAVERGLWTREQSFTLEESDRTPASSTIHTRSIGTRFTVDELLEELLVRSDNTAYNILRRNIPQSELLAVREAIGLEELFDAQGEVTAKEFSRLTRSLYTANYLNRANSEYLLELLDRAEFTDFLRKPVPETVPFPHKFGMGPSNNTYSDSGIVYIEYRPYLLTVMIEVAEASDDRVERDRAARVMRAISNMAFQFFLNAT